MESQEESSSSLQKSIYTNETDSENDSNDTPSITNILTGLKKKKNRKRLEKAQIRVIERDRLLSLNLINTESYFEEEDPGKVNDG
ncbi:11894_t:CDS:2, partial [Dentiscutata erythropus]